ncbi:calcium-binding protein [Bradyrhizobium sp. 26S5]|uniref:beta strand repeat-containing protein n=1 Tax=Bradyrhizobium sp. 26S5 TaxID=3139729 RepID=UPI0030CF12E0
MSTITYKTLTGTNSSETLTADVSYDSQSDTYEVINSIVAYGGDDTLTALSMPVTVNGQTLDFGTTLDGGNGNDVLNGGNRNDVLYGGLGSDAMCGGDGDDVLTGGGGGNDAYYGGDGNDLFSFGDTGSDIFDGGAGNDTLAIFGGDLSHSTITGIETLSIGNGTYFLATAAEINSFTTVSLGGGGGAGFALGLTAAGSIGSNFSTVNGGGMISGSSGADTIDLSSQSYDWTLYAGDNSGGNVLSGGSGNDLLNAGNGGDTLNGNGGNDRLNGGNGNDYLSGGTGNDTLYGYLGSDSMYGGDGDDVLDVLLGGGGGNDAYYGGNGNDLFVFADAGFDTFDGGAGNDTLAVYGADLSHSTITGVETLLIGATSFAATAAEINSFTTVSFGGGASFSLTLTAAGSIGSNFGTVNAYGTITGSSGADTIDMSASNSQGWSLYAGDDSGGNNLSGGSNNDVLFAGNGGDTLNGNGGDDHLTGGNGNDYLSGGAGNDVLYGGAGNDTLSPGTGSNTISGGAGNDTAVYTDGTRASFTVTDLGNGSFQVVGYGHDDTLSGVEFLQFSDQIMVIGAGTSGNDLLYGGAGDDILYGGGGNDVLVGYGGDDVGYGGDGNDYFYAGAGDDLLVGDAGLDVLLGEAGSDILYGGTGFNYLFGGDGNDLVVGSGGTSSDVNVMFGDTGADLLLGGQGTNYFYGGTGVDTMFGGSGLNIFISSGESDGNVIYGGSGQNYVYGSNGGDTVTGGRGVDVFLMGSGADYISGGGGVDYAWGGGGTDTFDINDTRPEVMVIQDFNTGGVNDILNFAATSLHSYADVQAAETYVAGINTTIITDAAGNAAWLIGLAPGQLDASMFKFS